MSGFRDLTAQCGEPTALSQLANSITQANPSILQDANVYKQISQPPQPIHPMEMQHRQMPNTQDLINEFNQLHLRNMPIPQPMTQNIIQQQTTQDFSNLEQQQQQQSMSIIPINNNNLSTMYMPQHPMMMSSMPFPMMQMSYQPSPYLMRMHEQYYNQVLLNAPSMNPQNLLFQQNNNNNNNVDTTVNNNQQQSEEKEIGELKDEQTVNDELNNLHPTYRDINVINRILNETQGNEKMENSQFMNFLRTLKDKEPVPDDLTTQWENEFKNWKPNDDIDSLHWQDYLESLDPTKPKEHEYTFIDDNHYMGEKNTNNENDNDNDQKTVDNNNNNNNDNNDKDLFAEGLRLMREGNLSEAILAFEACVQKEPKRSEAWRYLGQCHADNEAEAPAIDSFMKCTSLDPYDLDALLQLGVSYTNEIDSFHALEYLQKWIGSHPDYHVIAEQLPQPQETELMGGWLGSRHEHSRVVELFNKGLEINNKDPDLHIVLGVLYNITNEYDQAELHFKKALQARPNDPSLWNKLGATQANGQKCPEAIKAYSKALQLKPNYVRALSNLGISFANQNMHREACQSYLASLKQNPKADGVWDHLTMSLLHLNRNDLVELSYKKDVTLFKNHFDF